MTIVTAGLTGYEGRIPGTDKVGIRVRFYPPEPECKHKYKVIHKTQWDNAEGHHDMSFQKCSKCKVIMTRENIT